MKRRFISTGGAAMEIELTLSTEKTNMQRVFVFGGVGFGLGFALFTSLFFATIHPPGDRPILMVFALACSISLAAFFSVIGAFKSLQIELQELRRDMKHWQFLPGDDAVKPSSQFKSGDPPHRN
jgi:hypothetical protein